MRIVQNSNNIIRVLKSIWLKPGISRIEISKQIGLDKSTITVVVNRLKTLGFIEEISESLTPYIGGRKPIGLKISEDIGIILGLEIQTDYFIAILIGVNGEIIQRIKGKVREGRSFLDTFLDIYRAIFKKIEETGLPLLGIGIGTSGIIDTHEGVICDSNPLGIHVAENFSEEIKAFIHVPVFIENDANCGCWAELAFPENDRPQDFLFVLGEFRKARFFGDRTHLLAIGMGIVIKGQVHHGKEFSAGEYQSPQWLPENKTQFSMTDKELSEIKTDRDIVNRVKAELCRDVAYLVNILNLTQVSLAGGLADYVDELMPYLKEEVKRNWSYEKHNDLVIRVAPKGEDTVAYGAAIMLMEHLFLTYENPSENPWSQKVGIELFNSFSTLIKPGV
ncbi:MAG: ROK family transcriptional regulator [Spirochaetia bacterium]|nr:ROK family transcriptional regulator [Spirochaetia bacterium]